MNENYEFLETNHIRLWYVATSKMKILISCAALNTYLSHIPHYFSEDNN